jgi:hypothetical protein
MLFYHIPSLQETGMFSLLVSCVRQCSSHPALQETERQTQLTQAATGGTANCRLLYK